MTTKIKDITIDNYEKYLLLLSDETKDGLEKKIYAISLFSNLSIEDVGDMDIKDFKKLTKKLESINFYSKKIKPEITIDGVTYKSLSTSNEVKLNVKESFMIKETLENGVFPSPSHLMAILYRPTNNLDDYSIEGINQRKELFKNVSVEYILPYLTINEKS